MYVYPVTPDAALPDGVHQVRRRADDAADRCRRQDIAANRDQWIDEWTNVVLR